MTEEVRAARERLEKRKPLMPKAQGEAVSIIIAALDEADKRAKAAMLDAGEHRATVLNVHAEMGYPKWGRGETVSWPCRAKEHITASEARCEKTGDALKLLWVGIHRNAQGYLIDDAGAVVVYIPRSEWNSWEFIDAMLAPEAM